MSMFLYKEIDGKTVKMHFNSIDAGPARDDGWRDAEDVFESPDSDAQPDPNPAPAPLNLDSGPKPPIAGGKASAAKPKAVEDPKPAE